VQNGPAFGRRNDDLGRSGRAVKKGIFARLVKIKPMVSVLERGYSHSSRNKSRNQLGYKCRFAGTAPPCKSYYAHGLCGRVHALFLTPVATRPLTIQVWSFNRSSSLKIKIQALMA
jgi:hypothetical protein